MFKLTVFCLAISAGLVQSVEYGHPGYGFVSSGYGHHHDAHHGQNFGIAKVQSHQNHHGYEYSVSESGPYHHKHVHQSAATHQGHHVLTPVATAVVHGDHHGYALAGHGHHGDAGVLVGAFGHGHYGQQALVGGVLEHGHGQVFGHGYGGHGIEAVY